MVGALKRAGIGPLHALDLVPNDGRAPLESLAEQVDRAIDRVCDGDPDVPIDLVGHSMGALVSRYWLQRMGGRERTRRFVSIAGPHHGTVTAWGLPLAGVRQMRPGSAFLRDLADDGDPFGRVEVHALWTRLDLMIVPARSGRLPGAETYTFDVPIHAWMLRDPRVLARVVSILRAPDPSIG